MQCACSLFSYVAYIALQYFYTIKKNTEHTMCVLVVSTTFFEIFRILRRIERDTI